MEIQKLVSVATVMLFALIGLSNTTVADSVTCGGNAINHDTYCDELAGMPDAFDDGSHGTIGNPLLALQPMGVSDMNDGFAITIEPIGATEGRNNENTVTMPRDDLEFLVHVTQYNPATGLQEDYDISGLGWSFKLLGCSGDTCHKGADGEGNFHEWTGAQAVVTGTATGEGATRGYYRVQVSDSEITGDMAGFFAWTFIDIPESEWPTSASFQEGFDAASAYFSLMANGLADSDPGIDLFQQARTPIFFAEPVSSGVVEGADDFLAVFDFGPGGIPQSVNGEFTFSVEAYKNNGAGWAPFSGPMTIWFLGAGENQEMPWWADSEDNEQWAEVFHINGKLTVTVNEQDLPDDPYGWVVFAKETNSLGDDPSSHHMITKTAMLDGCHVDDAECQARLHAASILDMHDPTPIESRFALITPVTVVPVDDYTFSGAVSPPVGYVDGSYTTGPKPGEFDFEISLVGTSIDTTQFTDQTNVFVKFDVVPAQAELEGPESDIGFNRENTCFLFGRTLIEERLTVNTLQFSEADCRGRFEFGAFERGDFNAGLVAVLIDESGDGEDGGITGQNGYVHFRGNGDVFEGESPIQRASPGDDFYVTIEPRDAVETPIGGAMEYNRRFNYVFDVCAYNDDGSAWDFTDFRMELTTLDHVDVTVYYGDPSQPETYFDAGPEVLVEEETVAYSIGSYGNRDRDVPENGGDNCVVVSVPAFAKNQGLTGGTFQLGFWVSYEDTGKHGFYSEAVNNLHDANHYQAASLVDEGRMSAVLLLNRNTIPGGL